MICTVVGSHTALKLRHSKAMWGKIRKNRKYKITCCVQSLGVPGILADGSATTQNPATGEICLLWVICENTCKTAMLHLCSCCDRNSSISHKSNRPNLNRGVPQWNANICQLAKGESHLLYKGGDSGSHCCRQMCACLYKCCLYAKINCFLLLRGTCDLFCNYAENLDHLYHRDKKFNLLKII